MQTVIMQEEDESPPVSRFFSKRAKFIPKASAEELKAASELVNKIHEEKTKVTLDVKKAPPPARSPSPPTRKGRSKRTKKGAPDPEENIVENITEDTPNTPEVPLSAAAKRRLRKRQIERNLELKRVEAENKKVLSAMDSSECCEVVEASVDNFDNLIVLTISYMSEVSRLKCYKSERFSAIFPRVAELFKLKVSEFLLCLRDQNITVDDTLSSLNITDSDILECIPYKAEESSETAIEYDVDNLKITFQSSDAKRKIDMIVHKLEKMQDVMERYSKLKNMPVNLLLFEFDGEKITGTETADDLDMESGNCIDVTVLSSAEECTSRKNKVQVITVDSDTNDSDVLIMSE